MIEAGLIGDRADLGLKFDVRHDNPIKKDPWIDNLFNKMVAERDNLPLRGRSAEYSQYIPPTVEGIARLVREHAPQTSNGRFRWMMCGGFAVEAVTGVKRPHKDVDVVFFPEGAGIFTGYNIDRKTPTRFWAEMSFEPQYMGFTAWPGILSTGITVVPVPVVHPGITLVQKLSNAFDRAPRKKDIDDAKTLVEFMRTQGDSELLWRVVIDHAISCLPGKEQATTQKRVDSYGIRKAPFPHKTFFTI